MNYILKIRLNDNNEECVLLFNTWAALVKVFNQIDNSIWLENTNRVRLEINDYEEEFKISV